jgi:prepilin-type N-terminal cleavage/methylation domain-containing protein
VRRGFTLIELLVVVAVIALLIGLLVPALSRAREAGRAVACLSNQRQLFLACRAYADEFRGVGPALGIPYGTLPNWALVAQATMGLGGSTSADLYSERSALVCPTIRAAYGLPMQRTYAINVTGHAGFPGSANLQPDPDHYDDENWPVSAFGGPPRRAHINFDKVAGPARTVLFVDSKSALSANGTPSTRTASVMDFRLADHISDRLALFHVRKFNSAMLDGSARARAEVPNDWTEPLP